MPETRALGRASTRRRCVDGRRGTPGEAGPMTARDREVLSDTAPSRRAADLGRRVPRTRTAARPNVYGGAGSAARPSWSGSMRSGPRSTAWRGRCGERSTTSFLAADLLQAADLGAARESATTRLADRARVRSTTFGTPAGRPAARQAPGAAPGSRLRLQEQAALQRGDRLVRQRTPAARTETLGGVARFPAVVRTGVWRRSRTPRSVRRSPSASSCLRSARRRRRPP